MTRTVAVLRESGNVYEFLQMGPRFVVNVNGKVLCEPGGVFQGVHEPTRVRFFTDFDSAMKAAREAGAS